MAKELRRQDGATKLLAVMTATLINHMFYPRQINHTSAVHLTIHTRVDGGARTNVQSPKNGPAWDHVVGRVTMILGDNQIMRDVEIQGQPIGHNCNAQLPNSANNIRIR
eukprot:7011526-Pyramimonas_sp.AAC.1